MSGQEKLCAPTQLEKRLLVWFKKYPSMSEVPKHVSMATMDKIRNQARIRFNLALGVGFSLAFLYTAISSKRSIRKGDEGVMKQNIDWHKAYESDENIERKIPELKR